MDQWTISAPIYASEAILRKISHNFGRQRISRPRGRECDTARPGGSEPDDSPPWTATQHSTPIQIPLDSPILSWLTISEMTKVEYPPITFDAAGTARVGNSRYKVLHLVGEHYHYGWTAEEILRQHPDPRPEEIYAVLGFFYDHRELLLADLQRSADQATFSRATPTQLTRSELLARQSAPGGAS